MRKSFTDRLFRAVAGLVTFALVSVLMFVIFPAPIVLVDPLAFVLGSFLPALADPGVQLVLAGLALMLIMKLCRWLSTFWPRQADADPQVDRRTVKSMTNCDEPLFRSPRIST